MLGEDMSAFQAALERANEYALEIGIETSATETKLFVTPHSHKREPRNKSMANLKLDSTILSNEHAADTVKRRTDEAQTASLQMRNNFRRKDEMHLKAKLRILNAAVWSVSLSGCETWQLKTKDIGGPEVPIAGAFLKVSWWKRFFSEVIRNRAESPVLQRVKNSMFWTCKKDKL